MGVWKTNKEKHGEDMGLDEFDDDEVELVYNKTTSF